jgi:hypothetical protein
MQNDSRPETWEHIHEVQRLVGVFIQELLLRAHQHDQSKLHEPEKELFDKFTLRLKQLIYGSEEYKKSLEELKPALTHHYAKNSHHPEHYVGGIDDMTLVDVVEMLCDWKAATARMSDGNIRKSLIANKERFHISDQLYKIMENTIERLGW